MSESIECLCPHCGSTKGRAVAVDAAQAGICPDCGTTWTVTWNGWDGARTSSQVEAVAALFERLKSEGCKDLFRVEGGE